MAPNGVRATGGMSLGMESENFGYSRVRLRRVKKLQFGAVNPDELVSKPPCAAAPIYDRRWWSIIVARLNLVLLCCLFVL